MITAAAPIHDAAQITDANVVKVIFDTHGDALYFSAPLPFVRNPDAWPRSYRHLGIYGFQRSFLFQFVAWPPSRWSKPSLEQLRASKTAPASASCSPMNFPPAWTRRSRPPPSNTSAQTFLLNCEPSTANREPS
jgi:hypothetical protein